MFRISVRPHHYGLQGMRRLATAAGVQAQCPFNGNSTQASFQTMDAKPFDEMPGPKRYPFVGCLFDYQSRSKNEGIYEVAGDYYKLYGDIVRVNLMGKDDVWIYDPREMFKVFRAEGKYPDGPVRLTWPVPAYAETRNRPNKLLNIGEEWREHRMKLNKGIFNVDAAASFLPHLDETAKDLSSHVAEYPDLSEFCMLASFDLFCTAVIGKSLRVIDQHSAKKRDVKFADAAAKTFHYMGDLLYSPLEKRMFDMGMKTSTWRLFEGNMDFQMKVAIEIVDEVLNDVTIKDSYLKSLYETGLFTKEEAAMEVVNLLGAAVDTTATTMLWFIYELARNPDKQQKAAEEVIGQLKGDGFNRQSHLPYLKACYRESIRLSPIGNTGSFRTAPKDMVVRGYMIPKGVSIHMIGAHLQMDPYYVDNPNRFVPERWLPDQVEARKGTHKELLDHKLLAANFGFGPRQCLGARLAVNEMFAMVARLLQDYEITVAVPHERIKMRLLRAPDPSPQLSFRRRK
mmetsp:Transcript_23127/g.28427  ORF Transcript_23127/g.28427 Transcript_23127/m.28427 type:complete len:512 (+) Transcript_23127:82-1617(+)